MSKQRYFKVHSYLHRNLNIILKNYRKPVKQYFLDQISADFRIIYGISTTKKFYNIKYKEKNQLEKFANNNNNQRSSLGMYFFSKIQLNLSLGPNIYDNGKQISFFLKPSQSTYRLSTLWMFEIAQQNLIVKLTFYDKNQDSFLRAQSDRMKFQVYTLMRMINTTMLGYQFKIDTESGIIRVEYMVLWANFQKVFTKIENIGNLIKSIFNTTRKYDQLFVFIERCEVPIKQSHQDAKVKAQKIRYIMKARKNIRKNVQSSMGDLFKIKEIKSKIAFQNVGKVRQLFVQSINMLYQSIFENIDEGFDKENLQKQMLSIQKNQIGISSVKVKIVMGLTKIKQQSQTNLRCLSEEGAHAKIYYNRYRYSIVDTLYKGTVGFDPQMWENKVKDVRGDLAYKVCNKLSQPSRNSFKNQLAVLKYFKEQYSPYIARYYLQIKQQWNQQDKIYMQRYKKNLTTLIRQKNLTLKTKLTLAYGIAKGLCFMGSKNLLHRDFKPHNVLIDNNLIPKIIDFGSAAPKHGTTNVKVYDERLLYTQGFYIPYQKLGVQVKYKMKPQVYEKHPLFDVYGFGRTLSYLFFGNFNPPTPQMIQSSPYSQLLQHILFIIYMCMQVDPDQRPIFGELATYIGILPDFLKSSIGQTQKQSQVLQQKNQ